MLKVRLARKGAKKAPFYRIVVIDAHKKREGTFNDVIGWWNPTKKLVEINKEKLAAWIKKGALVS